MFGRSEPSEHVDTKILETLVEGWTPDNIWRWVLRSIRM